MTNYIKPFLIAAVAAAVVVYAANNVAIVKGVIGPKA